jgi:probable rRNA maturation factor
VNSIKSSTKVSILNLQKKIPVGKLLLLKIKTVVRGTLLSEEARGDREVSVCLVDGKVMKNLNRKYFGKNNPTDVIAFNTGDIAVSTDAAIINARIFKTTPVYELLLYVAHGVLHILGYDDKTIQERKTMENKAKNIIAGSAVLNVHT